MPQYFTNIDIQLLKAIVMVGDVVECQGIQVLVFISSVRSSNSHPDLLVITTPLFQITLVLNTRLSLSEPLQLYKGYNAI